jgi:uncharacterized damage-inducible protein DinB
MTQTTHPALAITPYWQSVQDDLERIVDLVPEGKMNFSPKPELWNFRGILIHVADARNNWMTRDVQDGEEHPNLWTTARTSDDLKRALRQSWERMNRFLANQSQLDKSYVSDYDGRTYDGHWIAFHLLEHDVHHRAELMQRLALLDVGHGIDL